MEKCSSARCANRHGAFVKLAEPDEPGGGGCVGDGGGALA